MTKHPLDHLRSRKKPIYFDFPIPEDASYQDRVVELARDLAQAQIRAGAQNRRTGAGGLLTDEAIEVDELKEKLEKAQADLAPHQIWFRARSLPPKQYDKLVSEYPPTEEQRKDAKKMGVMTLLYDYDKFLPVLATRCIYYLYTEDEDGEIVNAQPPLSADKREKEELPPVLEELITEEFLEEMKEDGHWAAGEIGTICQAASNVNQGIRKITELGNV